MLCHTHLVVPQMKPEQQDRSSEATPLSDSLAKSGPSFLTAQNLAAGCLLQANSQIHPLQVLSAHFWSQFISTFQVWKVPQ